VGVLTHLTNFEKNVRRHLGRIDQVALPQLSGGGHSIGPPVAIKVERFCARLAPSRTNSPTGGSKRAPGRREEPPGPSSHRSSVRFSKPGQLDPFRSPVGPRTGPLGLRSGGGLLRKAWRHGGLEHRPPWSWVNRWEAGARILKPHTVGPRCDRLIDESVHPLRTDTSGLCPLPRRGARTCRCTEYQACSDFCDPLSRLYKSAESRVGRHYAWQLSSSTAPWLAARSVPVSLGRPAWQPLAGECFTHLLADEHLLRRRCSGGEHHRGPIPSRHGCYGTHLFVHGVTYTWGW
jgi:hypothetical protein